MLLIAADAVIAGRNAGWDIHAPADVEVGQPASLAFTARFSSGRRGKVAAALACDPRLASGGRILVDLAPRPDHGDWRGETMLTADRRGTAEVPRAWLRWEGPLGLGARQVDYPLERCASGLTCRRFAHPTCRPFCATPNWA
jgi:uncharacterized protein (DUF58 family)